MRNWSVTRFVPSPGAKRPSAWAYPVSFSTKSPVSDCRVNPFLYPATKGGRTLLFPASALGRKGAYALREALYGLPIELAVKGHARESLGFWGNMPVHLLAPGEMPDTLAGVVLPALVEHQPRLLLAALAAGLPVIATPASGLSPRPGLTLVPEGDPAALRQALETLIA